MDSPSLKQVTEPELRSTETSCDNNVKEQWVKRVARVSSQYNNHGWSATSIVGSPRVYPRYGDIQGAWAQGVCDSNQYIEVEFEKALHLTRLDIYETLNAGSVVCVKAQSPSQNMVTLWQSDTGPSALQSSRIFSPPLQVPDYKVNLIRLEVDCTASGSWCELDAVKLVGRESTIGSPPAMRQLASDLYHLVDNPDYSDVTFQVEGHTVHAHKAILSSRSLYFSAMFSSGMREATASAPIEIKDVSYRTFLGLLQYFYTNTLAKDITPFNMLELMRVGDRFSAEGLDVLCFWLLSKELTVENVVSLYRSSMEGLPPLESVHSICLDFITSHMDTLSRRDDFSALTQAQMLEIIQHSASKLTV